jgi:hypothetical protein
VPTPALLEEELEVPADPVVPVVAVVPVVPVVPVLVGAAVAFIEWMTMI